MLASPLDSELHSCECDALNWCETTKILKGRRFQSWWWQDFEISYKEKFLSPKQNCFENSMVTHLKDIFLCSLSFNTFKRFCDGSHACAPLCIKESEKARRQDLRVGLLLPMRRHRSLFTEKHTIFTIFSSPCHLFQILNLKYHGLKSNLSNNVVFNVISMYGATTVRMTIGTRHTRDAE